jgi:hypothetical protein
MTQQQKQEFFLFLQKFCADNVGNRLNEWIIEAFLNRANQRLEAIPTYGNEAMAASQATQASQTSLSPSSHVGQDIATRSGKRKD